MKKPKVVRLVEYPSYCSQCDFRWDVEDEPFRFCPLCGKQLDPGKVVYEPNAAGRALLGL
jgi:rRNA maturation endonuclease Nob1